MYKLVHKASMIQYFYMLEQDEQNTFVLVQFPSDTSAVRNYSSLRVEVYQTFYSIC